MIINKTTKGFQTRSDKPNENWLNDDNYFVVQDGTELAQKITANYPNIEFIIENDMLVDVEVVTPEITPPTHAEINAMIVDKIREKYDINEEFKMINLGITDPENEQYKEYRAYVMECIEWGDSIEASE